MEYEKDSTPKESDFHIGFDKVESPYRVYSVSMGGSIISTPCITNDMIIFGSNDTYVYALDKEGNKLWSYKTADMVFSSPTCYDESIVIGSNDNYLYAFSRDGKLRWKFLTGERVWATPTIVDGVVYFGSNNGIFYALSLEDGKELWRFHASIQQFWNSPAVVNNSIIFGNMSGQVYCLSKDGRLLWEIYCGREMVQSPLIIDEKGNEISSFRKRSFYSFPKGEKCKVLFGSGEGYFRCLDANSSNILWMIFANSMGISSPTIYNDFVYFGSRDGVLYAVDTKGALKWKFQTGNRVVSSPICHDGIVYFGSSDNNLYALNAETGEFIWRFLTDGEIVSSPIIHKDVIYFGSWDGHLYALSIKDRTLLWKFRTALGFPSYIRKPTIVKEDKKEQTIEFTPTTTTKGYDVKSSNYSRETGELTNVFYGSPVHYKHKSPYEGRLGKY